MRLCSEPWNCPWQRPNPRFQGTYSLVKGWDVGKGSVWKEVGGTTPTQCKIIVKNMVLKIKLINYMTFDKFFNPLGS